MHAQTRYTTLPSVVVEMCIRDRGKVALTFDDGPSKYTIDIINVLKEYNVGSTFFFIGKHIYEFPEYVKDCLLYTS